MSIENGLQVGKERMLAMFMFLGLARVDFVNEKTGEVISGWRMWVAEPADAAPSVGLIPVAKWLKDEEYDKLIAPLGGAAALEKYSGKQIDLLLSLKGKIKGISLPQK